MKLIGTLIASIAVTIILLFVISLKSVVQTKQRIEPTFIIECSNKNCDTTYVYDFNTEEK